MEVPWALPLVLPRLHSSTDLNFSWDITGLISLCVGGSNAPVVTVDMLQLGGSGQGNVFPFDA